jgi:protein O-mannosyl-transferase
MKRATAAWLSAAAAFLVYLPSLSNGFVDWDDERYLLASKRFLGFGLEQLRWMFTTTLSGPYQPLSWMSLALDYQLWGPRAWGFHLTSALLHAANAALFCLIALELLGEKEDKASVFAALFSALVFALHPLRVESVAWASERRDVLCGFFYLLSIRFYLQGKLRPCLAAFAAALFSKGMAVTLPLTLVILDYYPLRRRAWAEKIPFFALSLAFGLVGWAGQSGVEPGRWPDPDWSGRFAQAAYGLVFYFGKTLWPADLSPLYLRPKELAVTAWPYAGCALGAAAVYAALASYRKRAPFAWAAALAYAAALFPVLGFVPFGRQLAADRYSYLPCLPLALLAGAAARHLWRRSEARLAAAVVLALLAFKTARQTGVWRDSVSLWARVAAHAPAEPMPRNSLGYALAGQRRFPEAEAQYRKAVELDPSYEPPHNNLGNILMASGRLPEAEASYRRAVELRPGYWEARSNLGLALARQNKLKPAAAELEEAARLKPDAAGIHKNLGLVYMALGRKDEAKAEFAEAVRLNAGVRR